MIDLPYPLVLACLVIAFYVGGAIGCGIALHQNRRKQSLIESKTRQHQLNAFWVAEQCRINPNMQHVLSEAIFHKTEDWCEHEQYLERGHKEWIGRKPRVRHKPEKPTWK